MLSYNHIRLKVMIRNLSPLGWRKILLLLKFCLEGKDNTRIKFYQKHLIFPYEHLNIRTFGIGSVTASWEFHSFPDPQNYESLNWLEGSNLNVSKCSPRQLWSKKIRRKVQQLFTLWSQAIAVLIWQYQFCDRIRIPTQGCSLFFNFTWSLLLAWKS